VNILSRLATRYRGDESGRYVCKLCGASFDDPAVVICPECRGLVTRRSG